MTHKVSLQSKTVSKRLLAGIAGSDRACRLLLPALREIQRQRGELEARWIERAIARTLPSMRVGHGPFQGLAYPDTVAVHSVLYPKLLGSYERELHGAVEEILQGTLTGIVNIGCAEGYYAVGLSLRAPGARVFAFDVDPQAREACRRMAMHNGVGDRFVIGEYCAAADLMALPLGDRGLVVSDCEGAELWILTAEAARALRRHHLIVETHDFLQPDISERLARRMAETHDVVRVGAVDDMSKVATYEYDELAPFTARERWRLLREGRPRGMSWLVCNPRGVHR